MKNLILIFISTLSLISCNKENGSLLNNYREIYGIWNTKSISWDSSGIRITHSSPYDKLVINNNLSYIICTDFITPVENGTVDIIAQSSTNLELFFAAKYPDYSSFAGSHIFGFSNVILVSLTSDEMILRSVDQGFYPDMEFIFRK